MPSKKICKVYIAGAICPYDSEHPVEGYWQNIVRGVLASLEVLEAGGGKIYPYCPFLDFVYYIVGIPHGIKVNERLLKEQDFPWLEVCDALLVLPRYRKSKGVKEEIEKAREFNIPVFYNLDDLIKYAEEEKKE